MTDPYVVEAYNTAFDSTNRMHDDAVAQTYGFRGGLVPGVDVWAYMTRPCVDRWGEEFLTGSTMAARFLAPVYDGELVSVQLADDGSLSVTGPDGTVRATGSASIAEAPPARSLRSAPRPDPAPPVCVDLLAAGTVLGTLRLELRRDLAGVYLGEVRDDLAIYRGGEICHPAFFARLANAVLHRNVVLGPWIHVATTAHHRGIARAGQLLDVRGEVLDEYERRGHRFVELAVEITADDSPVWSANHTAIWHPRQN